MGLAPAAGPERSRLAVLDARRGEAFAALFSPSGERVWGPWVGRPEQLGDRLDERSGAVLAGGSGAIRFRGELEDRGAEVPEDRDAAHRVSAANVCRVATGAGTAGQPDEPLVPIYLRAPDAERWRERDGAQS
jgi:tRNA threonylcarbamoyladenosine biosynthesis protein TsaB